MTTVPFDQELLVENDERPALRALASMLTTPLKTCLLSRMERRALIAAEQS